MNSGKYFIFFITIVLTIICSNLILNNWHYKEGDHRRLQKEINKKFRQTDRCFQKLEENNWQLNTPLANDQEISIVAFRNDSLVYWSDNTITFDFLTENKDYDKRFDSVSNGWYVIKQFVEDSIRAYGFILVKTQYPYENEFLVNRFQPDLKLPSSTELLTEPQPGSYAVHDWEGIYLFSIKFNVSELRFANFEKIFIPCLYLIAFICFLLLIHSILIKVIHTELRNILLVALLGLFIIIRWVQYKYHIPNAVYDLDLFGPVSFAKSQWLSSLGDVLLNTVLLMFIIIGYHTGYETSKLKTTGSKRFIYIQLGVYIAFLTGFFVYAQYILSSIILHSTINFEFYNVAGLRVYTAIGLLIAAIHFAALLLLSNRLLLICKATCSFKNLIWLFFLVSSVIMLVVYIADFGFDVGSHIAFIALFMLLAFLQYKSISIGNFTSMAFMVIFFSIYAVYFFNHFSRLRMTDSMKVMAENLANQHDPVAEYLFEDLSDDIKNDMTLNRYVFNLNISTEQIHNYLQSTYFNGFWGKYSLLIGDNGPEDKMGDSIKVYDFYKNMLNKAGNIQLPGSEFYYLDTLNGKINYFGWIKYNNAKGKSERSLFLFLESRLTSEELGYPDLLLDKTTKSRLLEEYSYAKYFKNQLLTQSGTFQYSLDYSTYKNKPLRFEKYYHFRYNLNADNVIMVSIPSTTFFNNLVSFSYIFLFFYAMVLIFAAYRNFSKLGKGIEFNFKNKIQISILAVLFLSLCLVGGGTIYFSIQQYQKKQHDLLSEKIQSVYIELDHLLAYLPNRISPAWSGPDYANLSQLLIKFSDVFYTDINLYDPAGNLLATSRDEIFDQGMQGKRMDPVAYSKMVKEKQPEFIHRERIGNMSYLSAYVPFVNVNNKLLAFLNLPYFTKQNVLRNDVTTLIVAIVNVYVLLILITIAVTAIIAEQITRPLRLIQKKFSEVKLGKKNEEILYVGRDEIAGLVDEYNRMVRELVKSVEMLSRSERESAWREMAKQVAHEIKNPLTPMKLSVQHLLRSWNDNRENFDEFLEKVTRTLIEQIDNLSFIASEFSNFAKMPKAHNEEINIVHKLKTTMNLFTNTENVDFVLEYVSDHICVMADKEQLSRVFINLIKNAIQSIPENRQGKISISLVLNGNWVRISITDNGKGIPDELQGKLFTPSFTTKTSGMGLGLSIVKNIIESFSGNITFKTKVNQGTTFILELPVHNKGTQPDDTH
jgi:two-component system, NtrC family, nitrogen regulation sensor histidine kinase NtrY